MWIISRKLVKFWLVTAVRLEALTGSMKYCTLRASLRYFTKSSRANDRKKLLALSLSKSPAGCQAIGKSCTLPAVSWKYQANAFLSFKAITRFYRRWSDYPSYALEEKFTHYCVPSPTGMKSPMKHLMATPLIWNILWQPLPFETLYGDRSHLKHSTAAALSLDRTRAPQWQLLVLAREPGHITVL